MPPFPTGRLTAGRPPLPRRRKGYRMAAMVSAAAVTAAGGGLFAGCGGGSPRAAGDGRRGSAGSVVPTSGAAASRPAAAGSTAPGPAVRTSGPDTVPGRAGSGAPVSARPCTPAGVVAGWPLARRVAMIIVAPIDRADPAAIAVARRDGVGGLLLLGALPPAGPLASALAPVRPGGVAGSGRAATTPMVMADEEGGGVQRLVPAVSSMPWPQEMARTMTPAQVRTMVAGVARQMRSLGVGVDLAPVADLDAGPDLTATDPDGPRSFSADPAVAASYATAFARGLADGGVLAVVKHFPGLGGSDGNSDYGPAATRPWAGTGGPALVPFRSAIGAGARAVMVANATVPGLTAIPASLSPAVITGVLRSALGFRGLVVTDSLSAGAVAAAGYGVPAAAAAAVEAGADMVLFGSTLTPADEAALAPGPLQQSISAIEAALTRAVRSGRLPVSRLDSAVTDVLSAEDVDPCRTG